MDSDGRLQILYIYVSKYFFHWQKIPKNSHYSMPALG
jgi:hypothetical protein